MEERSTPFAAVPCDSTTARTTAGGWASASQERAGACGLPCAPRLGVQGAGARRRQQVRGNPSAARTSHVDRPEDLVDG